MDQNIEKDTEYIGYGQLYLLFLKLYRIANKPVLKLKRVADKMRFEQYKMKFGEREDDIYIVTFPKSGTTLMQVILYQLTTSGDMGFNHIYDVSPWVRNASFKGLKVSNQPSPRIIKSHDYYKEFSKGVKGRFVFVYRNGMDVATSLYHQNKNYNNSRLIFDKFIDNFLKPQKKTWFNYTKAWFKNKHNFPILYLKYDDLLVDKEREIKKIIKFCNLDSNDEAISRALKYSSFEFMKEHESKFGEQPVNSKVYNQFIRNGKTGEGKDMFSEMQEQKFNEYYDKTVKAQELKTYNK